MNFKITRVTDKYDYPKISADAVSRTGRIVTFDMPVIGESLFMECVDPGFFKSIITSPVQDVFADDNGIVIMTNNSKYYLEKCDG